MAVSVGKRSSATGGRLIKPKPPSGWDKALSSLNPANWFRVGHLVIDTGDGGF